jgi:arylsulfatase A-like enzyme
VREPASLVDVAPTLLAAAGLRAPGGTSGRALLELARDPERALDERALFAHRVRGASDEALGARRPLWAVVDGPWKLLHDEEQASLALYDVASDPRETNDLAGEHPDVVLRLRERLAAFRQSAVLRAGAGVEVLLDPELLQELEALGYAGND